MLKPADLIEEFYKQKKEEYLSLSLEDFNKICKEPFYYLRNQIEGTNLPDIRLKYFGKFTVYPNKARAMLKYSKKKVKEKTMTVERYEEIKKMLSQYEKA